MDMKTVQQTPSWFRFTHGSPRTTDRCLLPMSCFQTWFFINKRRHTCFTDRYEFSFPSFIQAISYSYHANTNYGAKSAWRKRRLLSVFYVPVVNDKRRKTIIFSKGLIEPITSATRHSEAKGTVVTENANECNRTRVQINLVIKTHSTRKSLEKKRFPGNSTFTFFFFFFPFFFFFFSPPASLTRSLKTSFCISAVVFSLMSGKLPAINSYTQ